MKKEIKPLTFKVEARSAVPVYEQVKQAIKLYISSGYLQQGDQLMSIRDLGASVGIHPNTISKVYTQLETEGYVTFQPGNGYFVKVNARKTNKEKRELFEKVIDDAISRVIQLGYSLQEMIDELEKRLAESNPENKETVNDRKNDQEPLENDGGK